MGSNSSISSSKTKFPLGFLIMIVMIAGVETIISFNFRLMLPGAHRWWETKKLDSIGQIDPGQSPKKVIVIGDSTATNTVLTQKYGIENTAYGGGLVSSYYFLKTFIKNNGKPELCLFLFNDMQWALKDVSLNDFYRPFFSYSRITDFLFEDKNPELAWRMFSEGFLPSHRYRIFVMEFLKQHKIYDLNEIKFKVTKSMAAGTITFDWKEHHRLNDTRMRKGYILPVSPMQRYFFSKICDLFRKNNIKLVVWESPIPETRVRLEEPLHKDYMVDVDGFLKQFPDVIVSYKTRFLVFKDDVFIADGAHVKGEFDGEAADTIYAKLLPLLNKE